MPQVPYVPYPTAQPSTQGTPTLRLNTPSEAFGANVGQAIEGFGKGLEADSDKIFNRAIALQEMQNETAARNADVQASIDMGNLHAKFSALEGVNAGPKALEQYTSDLRDVYQKGRAALPNDDARRRYDSQALSVLARSIFNGAGHSAQQMKQASVKSAQAQVAQDADDLYNNPNEQGLDVYLDKARTSAHTVAAAQGLDPIATKELEDKYTSHQLSHLITGRAKQEPWKAGELLEQYRDRLHGEDITRVENSVQQAQRTTGARMLALQVNADLNDPDMEDHRPLTDRIKDVRELAAKQVPNDQLLPAYAEAQVEAGYNRWKQVQRDTEFQNKQTIEGALVGNYGKVPVTVDELRAIPDADAAWSSLKPSTQRHYLNVMSQIQRTGDRIPPAESLVERQKYVGMAQTDPAAFLDADVLGNEGLNIADKKYLIGLQGQVKKSAVQDPRLTRALQILGPDLQAAGISKSADPTTFYKYTGALFDQLQDYQTENKKAPKPEEVQAIGRRLLQEQAQPGRFWGTNQIRTFELSPPQETIDMIKDDIKSKDPTAQPTDEQIIRAYIREKYKRLYDTAAPSAGGEK
jgi:hypothetical protein